MGGCTPNNTNLLLFMSLVTRRSLSWVQVLSPSYPFHPKIRSLWISDDTLDSTLAKVRFTLDINNWGTFESSFFTLFSVLYSSSFTWS